jgi:SulP family sulfate permease
MSNAPAEAPAADAPNEPSFTERAIKDLIAGLTVSFVAISLGAAFGAFAGRGAMSGILSAGVICFICALLGGTRIQCSGPTAPMSAVMLTAVVFAKDELDKVIPGANPDQFLNIVLVLTGGMIMLMALLRLGKFITYVPKIVISGFMNGIAVLIWVGETKTLFGLGGKDPLEGGIPTNLVVALITTAMCFAMPPLLKKIPKVGHYIPGALAGIVIMTVGVNAIGLDIAQVKMGGGDGSFVDMVKEQFPRDWSGAMVWVALPFVLNLSLLAYLDTLLTALVVDKLVKEDLGLNETSKQNKELAAQGLANGLVGLFGGIPGAQATIRSVLILKEGATMRLAGVAAGLFVLVEMIAFQDLIAMIPSAVFSGVLLKVGYDVMDWQPLKAAGRQVTGRKAPEDARIKTVAGLDLFFIIGTTVVTILVNLNVAVISFVILFYVLKKAGKTVPDLPELADAEEEWVSDHEEGLEGAQLDEVVEEHFDHDAKKDGEAAKPAEGAAAAAGGEAPDGEAAEASASEPGTGSS